MMVGALEDEKEAYRSKLGHFKGMYENNGRQKRSSILDNNNNNSALLQEDGDGVIMSRSLPPSHDQVQQRIGCLLNRTDNVKSRLANDGSSVNSSHANSRHPSDIELMKEKFAKLLLGEDMSGGGKGVSSALALSNAITNLAASVFGEQKRLEPMSAETKARWRKEIDWLLSVTDHIVEFAPSKQRSKDGSSMEIMTTRQRSDLHINIPALRKLDAMLLDCLDNFRDQNEFYYEDSKEGKEGRKDDKWWIPTPKVPPNGLSEVTRKWVQCQKDSVNQVLKAAMAINAQVLSEMEIPESYIDALPKNGRATLGDSIYKSITDDFFDPDYFLSSMDMSSEHKIADLKNKIEASVVIWQRKMNSKDSKSSWVSMEKREILEDRAETILLILKHRFPGLPQSDLDINKIEYNKDVGQAILESYSRIIESLAFTVMSRIDDVMQADASARNPSSAEHKSTLSREIPTTPDTVPSHREEMDKLNSGESEAHNSMTLLDFMGWNLENGESETNKDSSNNETETKGMSKVHANVVTDKRMSYIEKLEILGGFRSPTARH